MLLELLSEDEEEDSELKLEALDELEELDQLLSDELEVEELESEEELINSCEPVKDPPVTV